MTKHPIKRESGTIIARNEIEYKRAPMISIPEYNALINMLTSFSPTYSFKRMHVRGISIAKKEMVPKYFVLPSLHLSASPSSI